MNLLKQLFGKRLRVLPRKSKYAASGYIHLNGKRNSQGRVSKPRLNVYFFYIVINGSWFVFDGNGLVPMRIGSIVKTWKTIEEGEIEIKKLFSK